MIRLTGLRILGTALVTFVFAAGCGSGAPPPVSPGSDITLAPDTELIRGEVEPSATLDAMLREHGLAAQVVNAVVGASQEVFDPRRLRAAQPFLLERDLDGRLRHFEYEIDADSLLRVIPVAPGAEDLRAEVMRFVEIVLQNCAIAAGVVSKLELLIESSFAKMDAVTVLKLINELRERDDLTRDAFLAATGKIYSAEDSLSHAELMLWIRIMESLGKLSGSADCTVNGLRIVIENQKN